MSAFFGRGRTTPPHGLIELDRSNPLTNGLVGAYTPGGQNAVTRTFAETLTATKGVSRQGPALLFAAGSETAKFDSYLPTNVFTSLTLLTPNFSSASTTRQGIWMFQASAGSVQNRLRLIWLDATNGFYLDTNSGFAYWCKPTFSAGDALSIAYVRSGTGGINQFYINGRPQTTNLIVDVGGGIPASATPMWLGDDIESSSGRRLNGAIALHLHYSRALSAPELKSLQDNPWQIFARLPRRLFDAVAGGTDYPVTQTEAATASDTASCLIGYAPAATEAGSASDAASAAMAAVVAIIEAASATSSEAAVTARQAAITEAATATDTTNGTASGDYTATITEAATASSLEAAVSNYLAAISESASASGSASASLPGEYSVSISEAASAIETAVCAMSALVTINEAAAAADASNWVGAITYTRAPRGGGYPGTRPTTTRGGQTNTTRPTMANTRR